MNSMDSTDTSKDFVRNHKDFMVALSAESLKCDERSEGELEVITTALKRAHSGNTVPMLITYGEKTREHTKDEDVASGAEILLNLIQSEVIDKGLPF